EPSEVIVEAYQTCDQRHLDRDQRNRRRVDQVDRGFPRDYRRYEEGACRCRDLCLLRLVHVGRQPPLRTEEAEVPGHQCKYDDARECERQDKPEQVACCWQQFLLSRPRTSTLKHSRSPRRS